jgi:hypothetical protein
MRRAGFIASAAAGTLLLASALSSSRGADRRAPCAGSLVPAYLHPQEIERLAQRSTLPQLLVINPASGPGSEPRPDYRRAIGAARAGGARVLGYVATGWASRPLAAVEADIDRYREWYGLDDVFLDEAAASEEAIGYYAALRSRAGFVVLNPGVVPARDYFDVADVVVTFEGPFAAYGARERDPVPERSAHLVYATSREQALGALERREPRYAYFTSGGLPHPWGTVPAYLAPELTALGGCA